MTSSDGGEVGERHRYRAAHCDPGERLLIRADLREADQSAMGGGDGLRVAGRAAGEDEHRRVVLAEAIGAAAGPAMLLSQRADAVEVETGTPALASPTRSSRSASPMTRSVRPSDMAWANSSRVQKPLKAQGIAPTRRSAQKATTHSHRFAAKMATRSPGRIP